MKKQHMCFSSRSRSKILETALTGSLKSGKNRDNRHSTQNNPSCNDTLLSPVTNNDVVIAAKGTQGSPLEERSKAEAAFGTSHLYWVFSEHGFSARTTMKTC